MPDQMYLVITVRKPVADRDEAKAIYDVVKQRLVDRPDLKVKGQCSNHFDIEEPT